MSCCVLCDVLGDGANGEPRSTAAVPLLPQYLSTQISIFLMDVGLLPIAFSLVLPLTP